jgi:hypothetical protein
MAGHHGRISVDFVLFEWSKVVFKHLRYVLRYVGICWTYKGLFSMDYKEDILTFLEDSWTLLFAQSRIYIHGNNGGHSSSCSSE